MFARTLPLTVDLETYLPGNEHNLEPIAFQRYCQSIQSELGSALDHQDVSLLSLLSEPGGTDSGRHPFFNIMFTTFTHEALPVLGDELQLSRETWPYPASKFDMNFMVYEDGETARIDLEFATELFDPQTTTQLLTHYLNLLEYAAEKNALNLSALMSEQESNQVINKYNDTAHAYDKDSLIHHLFEKTCSTQPDALAIDDGFQKLSYGELEHRANQVAHFHLKELWK